MIVYIELREHSAYLRYYADTWSGTPPLGAVRVLLGADELADYQRVEAEWERWQERLQDMAQRPLPPRPSLADIVSPPDDE